MPLSGGKYVAPHWVNGGPPALDAAELNAISQTLAQMGNVASPAQQLGLTGDLSVGASLGVLAKVGDLHVWRKVTTSSSAGYSLSAEKTNGTVARGEYGRTRVSLVFGSSISVANDGTVTINNPTTNTFYDAQSGSWPSISGKFARIIDYAGDGSGSPESANSSFPLGSLLYVPSSGRLAHNVNGVITLTKYQIVTSYAAGLTTTYPVSTKANAYTEGTTGGSKIEYLGKIGDKVGIRNSSYVGTGAYGSSTPCRITFDFKPKLVVILSANARTFSVFVPGQTQFFSFASGNINYNIGTCSISGRTLSYSNGHNADHQMNTANMTYLVTAFG